MMARVSLTLATAAHHPFLVQRVFDCSSKQRGVLKLFHTSQKLEHAPNVKKKKKTTVDQAKEKIRKDKQEAKRRAEPILIPLDPDSVPNLHLMEKSKKRQVTEMELAVNEQRILLCKEWARYTMKSHREELYKLQLRAKSRQDALNELRKISSDLYNEAIKVNRKAFPLTLNGPVETPSFYEYIPPDLDDVNIKQAKKL